MYISERATGAWPGGIGSIPIIAIFIKKFVRVV